MEEKAAAESLHSPCSQLLKYDVLSYWTQRKMQKMCNILVHPLKGINMNFEQE